MRRRYPMTLRANIADNMSNVAVDRVLEDIDRNDPYRSAIFLCLSALSRLPKSRTEQSERLRGDMYLPADVSEQRKLLRTPFAFEDLAHQTFSYVQRNGSVVYGDRFGYLPYARPGGRKSLCMTELPLGMNPLMDLKHASRRDLFPRNILSIPRLYEIKNTVISSEEEKTKATEKITDVGKLLHTFARDVLTAAGVEVPVALTQEGDL